MTEIHIKQNEQKDIFLINPKENYAVRFIQEEGSILNIFWFQVALGKETFNHAIEVFQQGGNANLCVYGLGCLADTAEVQFVSTVHHQVPQGNSSQLFKYVLKDQSRGKFDGRVIIAPNAQKTKVQQVNKNIVLSPSATMDTQPQLEIYADDVKASHGATVGQLDEEAIFYMQQRGIHPKTAYSLLLQAFVNEIVQRLPDTETMKQTEKMVLTYMNNL